MFFSRSCIVLGLMIKSLIHFELVFVYKIYVCKIKYKIRFYFILLHIDIVISTSFIEDTIPSQCSLGIFIMIIWLYMLVFLSRLSVLFHCPICLFLLYCFDCCSFVICFEVRKYKAPKFVLISPDGFGYSVTFADSYAI